MVRASLFMQSYFGQEITFNEEVMGKKWTESWSGFRVIRQSSEAYMICCAQDDLSFFLITAAVILLNNCSFYTE